VSVRPMQMNSPLPTGTLKPREVAPTPTQVQPQPRRSEPNITHTAPIPRRIVYIEEDIQRAYQRLDSLGPQSPQQPTEALEAELQALTATLASEVAKRKAAEQQFDRVENQLRKDRASRDQKALQIKNRVEKEFAEMAEKFQTQLRVEQQKLLKRAQRVEQMMQEVADRLAKGSWRSDGWVPLVLDIDRDGSDSPGSTTPSTASWPSRGPSGAATADSSATGGLSTIPASVTVPATEPPQPAPAHLATQSHLLRSTFVGGRSSSKERMREPPISEEGPGFTHAAFASAPGTPPSMELRQQVRSGMGGLQRQREQLTEEGLSKLNLSKVLQRLTQENKALEKDNQQMISKQGSKQSSLAPSRLSPVGSQCGTPGGAFIGGPNFAPRVPAPAYTRSG